MNSKRYIRQESLNEIGKEGQVKLAKARIAIIGCGGLGSIAAPYLAGAGVGHLVLIDGDAPELSNLHRQVFFTGKEKGSKAEVLAAHIAESNPEIIIEHHSVMLYKTNIASLITEVDLVLECTDDMMCKYLVNDWCHLNRIPLVYGAIFKTEGYLSLFSNHDNKDIHLRDIFPVPDLSVPSCSEVGVINTIAGLIGILQANEALKYILGNRENLSGWFLTYDVMTTEQLKLKLKKTWEGDMQDLYLRENYDGVNCNVVPELSINEVLENMNEYLLISILELGEHQAIHSKCLHQPLSKWEQNAWVKNEKPQVYYCISGKRSSNLVNSILDQNPTANVFSLKGGLRTFLEKEI